MAKSHPIVYSAAPSRQLIDPLDMHKEISSKNVEVAGGKITGSRITNGLQKVPVETEWLHSAARAYNISPSIKDYVMVPVIIFYADMPNKNGFGFSLSNLASWSSEHGMSRYQTWRGKPVFLEHSNTDVSKALGIVLDTFLRRSPAKDKLVAGPRGDYWKELAYLAVDRGKNKEVANGILNKDVSTYSMGTIITGGYVCSVCQKKVGLCRHLDMRKPRYGMKLVDAGKDRPELAYVVGLDPVGFEVSVVNVPAYEMAENDRVQFFETAV